MAHEAISLSVALIVWVVAGFAIDSVGTYVEVYGVDCRRPDHEQMLVIWWRYLRIAWVHKDGRTASISSSYGPTKDYNSHSIEMKLPPELRPHYNAHERDKYDRQEERERAARKRR